MFRTRIEKTQEYISKINVNQWYHFPKCVWKYEDRLAIISFLNEHGGDSSGHAKSLKTWNKDRTKRGLETIDLYIASQADNKSVKKFNSSLIDVHTKSVEKSQSKLSAFERVDMTKKELDRDKAAPIKNVIRQRREEKKVKKAAGEAKQERNRRCKQIAKSLKYEEEKEDSFNMSFEGMERKAAVKKAQEDRKFLSKVSRKSEPRIIEEKIEIKEDIYVTGDQEIVFRNNSKVRASGYTKEETAVFRESQLAKKHAKRKNKIARRKEAREDKVKNFVTESGFLDTDFCSEFSSVLEKLCPHFDSTELRTLAVALYQIVRSRNIGDYLAAFHQAIVALDINVVGYIDVVKDHWLVYRDAVLSCALTTESYTENLEGAMSVFYTVLSSEMVTIVRNIIVTLASRKWFEKDVAKEIFSYLGEPRKMCFVEFLDFIITSLHSFAKIAANIMDGASLTDALFSKNPLQTALSKVRMLLKRSDFTYSGLPRDGHVELREFIVDLEKNLKIVESAKKYVNPLSSNYIDLNKVYLDGINVLATKKSEILGRARQTPMGIVLVGPSAIGKGPLIPYICKIWSKVKGREFARDQVFDRSASSPYWEGYNPDSHPFIHYSEVANKKADIASKLGDDRFDEILSLIDSMTFRPDMAFGDKGKICAYPEMVIADTNNESLNVKVLYHDPEAYKRRFVFVVPSVLPEFRLDGSEKIDPVKSLAKEGHLLDRFTFKVYTIYYENKLEKQKILLEGARLGDFTTFMSHYFEKHILVQEDIIKRLDENDLMFDDYNYKSTSDYYSIEEASFKKITSFKEATTLSEKEILKKAFDNYVDYNIEDKNFEFKNHTCENPDCYECAFADHKCDVEHCPSCEMVTESFFFPEIKTKYCSWSKEPQKGDIPRVNLSNLSKISFKYYDQPITWCHRIFAWLQYFVEEVLVLAMIFVLLSLLPNFRSPYSIVDPKRITLALLAYFIFNMQWTSYFLILFSYCHEASWFSKAINSWLLYKKIRLERKISKSWIRLKSLVSLKEYVNPFNISDSRIAYFYGVMSITAIIAAYYSIRSESEHVDTDKPETEHGETLDVLYTMENKFGAGSQIKRVKTVDKAIWNSQIIVDKTVFTGQPWELEKAFSRNVRYCQIENKYGKQKTYICGVDSNFALINEHVFCGLDEIIFKISNGSGIHVDDSGWITFVLKRKDCVKVVGDVLLFDCHGLRFKSILKHMTNTIIPGNKLGRVCNADIRADFVLNDIMNIGNKYLDNVIVDNYLMYEFPDHKPGICGTPVYCSTGKGASFIGIHCGGDSRGDTCVAQILTKDIVKKAICDLGKICVFRIMSESLFDIDFEDPSPKSFMHFEILNDVSYFGKIPGITMMESSSRLKKSKISDDIEKMAIDNFGWYDLKEFGRPLMRPKVLNGVWVSPYNITMRKISTPKKSLDKDILTKCVDIFVERIIKGLNDAGIVELVPLTAEQAINGVEGDDYIRRINASAAAGFGFPGPKSAHLPLDENGIRTMTPELKAKVIEDLERYSRGESCHYVYKAKLKDEPRLMEKVKTGKTRMFYMSPLNALIISRMFLSPFYSLMSEFNDLFCTAVGTDIHKGADKIYNDLKEFSEMIGEGDYEGYDTKMPYGIGEAASSVIFRILEHLGYNEYALKVVRGILTDNLFPYVEILKDMVMAPGLQVSGKYATAEDNSLRNVLLLIYCWYANGFDVKYGNVFDWVKALTFGDDFIFSTKCEEFNLIMLSVFSKRIFGMTLTTPSKGDVTQAFITVDEMTFLKRSFVFSEKLNRRMGRLDKSSIVRALTWIMPSTFVSDEEQIIAACQSMMWEMSLGYEELADQFRNTVINALHINYDIPIKYLHRKIPTSDSVRESCFGEEENSVDTLLDGSGQKRGTNFTPCLMYSSLGVSSDDSESCTIFTESMINSSGLGVTRIVKDLEEKSTPLVASKKENLEELKTRTEKRLEELDISIRAHPHFSKVFESELSHQEVLRDPTVRVDKRLRRNIGEYFDHKATMAILNPIRGKKIFNTESGEMSSDLISGSVKMEHENVTDVVGEDEKMVEVGCSEFPINGQLSLIKIEDFFSRPVKLLSVPLTLGSDIYLTLDIWDSWTKEPSVRAKLKNFAYISADIHVKITMSGTPFHYGRFLFSYQPYAAYNENVLTYQSAMLSFSSQMRKLFMNYLSQSDGAFTMDVRANKPTEFFIPFISFKPMYRLYNTSSSVLSDTSSYDDIENVGTLFIMSMNQVNSVSSGSPSPPRLNVYAWATNVKLGTTTGTQIQITTESGPVDEFTTGPVERVASRAASISNWLKRIPMIEPLATASSIFFTALGDISAIFGWSRPVVIDDAVIVKGMPFQNGAQTIGSETTQRITLDPKQEITVDPRSGGCCRDEMVISDIASRMSYLETFTWHLSDSPFSVFWKCRNTPRLDTQSDTLANTWYAPTAMSFAVTPFTYWNGSITYRFEVACSAFHRGKIGVFFEPNVSQEALISANLKTNKQFLAIVDIQETQVFEVCVKWAAPRQWCMVSLATDGYYGGSIVVDNPLWSNGYIGVFPFTVLQSPDSSDVDINCFVCCKDLRVNQLTDRTLPIARDIISESGVVTGEEVSCIDLNLSSAKLDDCSIRHFGESPVSFRALLKRYAWTMRYSITGATEANGRVRIIDRNFPENNLPYGSNVPIEAGINNLFNYLQYAFLGCRGGIRKRLHVSGHFDVNHDFDQVKVTIPIASASESSGISSSSTDPPVASLGGTVTFSPSVNAGVEYEIPYYSANLFFASFADDMMGGVNTDEIVTAWNKISYIDIDCPVSFSNLIVDIETAAGEDFTFFRYQGAPYYTNYQTPG